jgi:hypothetical protein
MQTTPADREGPASPSFSGEVGRRPSAHQPLGLAADEALSTDLFAAPLVGLALPAAGCMVYNYHHPMVCQLLARKVLALAALLFGLASVAWMWSSVDYTVTNQVRTRTTRSLRADDSDLAHEHGVLPHASVSTQAAPSIAAYTPGDDGGAPVAPSAAVASGLASPFEGCSVSLKPFPADRLIPVFAGFDHALRGPPFLS